jgi:hypothetical protein
MRSLLLLLLLLLLTWLSPRCCLLLCWCSSSWPHNLLLWLRLRLCLHLLYITPCCPSSSSSTCRSAVATCLDCHPASWLLCSLRSVKHNCLGIPDRTPASTQQQPQPLQPCTRAKQRMRLLWQVRWQLHCPLNMYLNVLDLLQLAQVRQQLPDAV